MRSSQEKENLTYFQSEDHQAELGLSGNLKSWVSPNISLKQLCHPNSLKEDGKRAVRGVRPFKYRMFITKQRRLIVVYVSDPSLNVFQSEAAQNKPEFQRAERFPEANLPVLSSRKERRHDNNNEKQSAGKQEQGTMNSMVSFELSCAR